MVNEQLSIYKIINDEPNNLGTALLNRLTVNKNQEPSKTVKTPMQAISFQRSAKNPPYDYTSGFSAEHSLIAMQLSLTSPSSEGPVWQQLQDHLWSRLWSLFLALKPWTSPFAVSTSSLYKFLITKDKRRGAHFIDKPAWTTRNKSFSHHH